MDTIKTKRYADYEWTTFFIRLMLNPIGIWPGNYKSVDDKFLTDLRAMFALMLLIFVGFIPYLYSLLRVSSDLMLIIDNLQFTLPELTTILKLVIIWWKKTDLSIVINVIFEDWMKIKTDKELHNMIKRARVARILGTIGCFSTFTVMGTMITLACFGKSVRYVTNITNTVKVLPLQTDYFYGMNQSPYFEFTFVAQIITLIIFGFSFSGVDNLFGLLVFHLCGQMENLKEKIINMGQFNNFNDDLVFIVKDHIRIIKCFDIIEETFNLLLFVLLLYVGISSCLFGFLIITILTEGNNNVPVFRITYLIIVMIYNAAHVCLFCAVGEVLVIQCEDVYQAAYAHKWYKLKPKEARLCILIMIQSKKPLYITAGKMFPMTMSTFCSIIKTSAGYMSVLLAMKN